jgi:GH25 family lysozyme M1 (1,4-beta-N-acetylmuramidase)
MTRLARGIDVGVDNGDLTNGDWVELSSGGVEFALLRCSEDNDPVDPTYARNLAGALVAARTIGSYAVATFLPGVDAAALAQKHFVQSKFLGGTAGTFAPTLDLETPAPQDWKSRGVTGQMIVDGACAYGASMQKSSGRRSLLYTYTDFLVELAKDGADLSALAQVFDLWFAQYPYTTGVAWPSDDDVVIPTRAPWTSSLIWQVTNGRVGEFRVPNGCPTDTCVILASDLEALAAK